MSDRTRIPDSIQAFDKYINTTDNYQQAEDPLATVPETTHAARLGLSPAESDAWSAKRVYWRDTLFKKYSNPITSSSTVKKDVQLFMRDFRTFANPLLNKMVASGAATTDNGAIFNFVAVRDTTPTPRGKINDIPFCKLIPLGGGELKIKVRTTDDGNRASRHPLSDGVEVRWAVVAPASGNGNDPILPTISSDCPNTLISPKAIFILETGEGSKNKNLYCFFRWINLSNPAHNGTWSERFQSGIL